MLLEYDTPIVLVLGKQGLGAKINPIIEES
jgi:hypothetical protein